MSTDKVVVALPTYNEIENLSDIAQAVMSEGYDLLIIDDNSPDGTGAVADALAAEYPSISVLHRDLKQGLGPAYSAGFDRLLAEGANVIIEMDADFSHDPKDLPRLVKAVVDGADLAIGSRYVPGGSTPDWPLIRRMISKSGNIYARLLLGLPVQDATAGFRAFRADALTKLPYRDSEASGYGFQVEMAWKAVQNDLEIVEVPIVFRDRTRGKSKMGFRIVLEAMWLVTMWGFGRLIGRGSQ